MFILGACFATKICEKLFLDQVSNCHKNELYWTLYQDDISGYILDNGENIGRYEHKTMTFFVFFTLSLRLPTENDNIKGQCKLAGWLILKTVI